MKKIRLINILFTIIVISVLVSCRKDTDPGGTAMQTMAGEWWVQVRDANGNFTDDFKDDYYHFSTYNTAANSSTEMWLDDLETFWAIKGKVGVNLGDKTFSTPSLIPNTYYESNFQIKNGKILPKASKGPVSKAVTDSIYFETILDDYDPNVTLYLSGYRRTKYSDDDH